MSDEDEEIVQKKESSGKETFTRRLSRKSVGEASTYSTRSTVSEKMKGGLRAVKHTLLGSKKDGIDEAMVRLCMDYDDLSDKERMELVSLLKSSKAKDRAGKLLELIEDNRVFSLLLPKVQANKPCYALFLDVLKDIAQEEEFKEKLLEMCISSIEFWDTFVLDLKEGRSVEVVTAELGLLQTLSSTPKNIATLMEELKSLWDPTVLDLLRYSKNQDVLKQTLLLLTNLSQEDTNVVNVFARVKPVLKVVIDLVHPRTTDPDLISIGLILLSRFSTRCASELTEPLKNILPVLEGFFLTNNTHADVINATISLLLNLSHLGERNQTFSYSDLKPVLSPLMELVRNPKTPPKTTCDIVTMFTHLAISKDNREPIHQDLLALHPMFVQFVSKPTTPEELVLATFALWNNLAFVPRTQVVMFTQELPSVWSHILSYIKQPRSSAIQEMVILLIRNLAFAPENKVPLLKELKPVWPVILDLLRAQKSDDMVFGCTQLLWYLSKDPANRIQLLEDVQTLIPGLLNFIRLEMAKETSLDTNLHSVYAICALLKNLAEAEENRVTLWADVKPYLEVFFSLFSVSANAKENQVDVLELVVWCFQILALDARNQASMYVDLKPIQSRLFSWLRNEENVEDLKEQILLLLANLAKGKTHAAWVYVDLEPCRSTLRDFLMSTTHSNVLQAIVLLYSRLVVDSQNAQWMYKEFKDTQHWRVLIENIAKHDNVQIADLALRLLSGFATPDLRAELLEHQPGLIKLLENDESGFDGVMALAILCGSQHVLLQKWFANDDQVLVVMQVLEDCLVLSEYGYELERPLEALSNLIQIPSMRSRVKISLLLEAVNVAWKRKDMSACKYGIAVLSHCVEDDNNNILFLGKEPVMEAAKALKNGMDESSRKIGGSFLDKLMEGRE